MRSEHLDEVYDRLHETGPEFDGWLSNHGPMAADALIRLGRDDVVEAWLDHYVTRLEERVAPRWTIRETDWREPLGDPSRLGDWTAFFSRAVRDEAWETVLVRWWPRLLPGGVAAATHPLIRTGHAVRALGEADTISRREELAAALGYWAARWQPLPGQRPPAGNRSVGAALVSLPVLAGDGGITARLSRLPDIADWPAAQAALRPVPDPADVPAALDALVDAAVGRYAAIAHGGPVMLVHSATAPRAARLTLAALPQEMWVPTYDAAWSIAAAITTIYAPARPAVDSDPPLLESVEDVAELAAAHGDEHVLKFTEVAVESYSRGTARALPAARTARRLISTS